MGICEHYPAVSQNQSEHGETLPGDDGTPIADSSVVSGELNNHHLADADLLAAISSSPSDVLENIEQTLDHLTSAINLFDVPPFDLHGPVDS